jgi:hypothetical protein
VLKWRGPETLYSSNVQQAVTNGSMKAALDLLPEQGLAAATAALLEVFRQSALSAGQPLLQRCCPQPPRRFSAPWFDGTCARLRRQYTKQCTRFGAHHPEVPRLLRQSKQHCNAKKKVYSRSAADSIVMTAKRNPECSGATCPVHAPHLNCLPLVPPIQVHSATSLFGLV